VGDNVRKYLKNYGKIDVADNTKTIDGKIVNVTNI
jgi:hypothetical protein